MNVWSVTVRNLALIEMQRGEIELLWILRFAGGGGEGLSGEHSNTKITPLNPKPQPSALVAPGRLVGEHIRIQTRSHRISATRRHINTHQATSTHHVWRTRLRRRGCVTPRVTQESIIMNIV